MKTCSNRINIFFAFVFLFELMLINPRRVPGQEPAELSAIETKYDFVEIWDEQGRSRTDFLNEITKLPAGICEQSLVQMGHSDGNKFPLASGKLLLTTRSAPDFRDSPTFQRLKSAGPKIDEVKWAALVDADLLNTEAQLLPGFLIALRDNDNLEFERILKEKQVEFGVYGLKVDPAKVRAAYDVYQAGIRTIAKHEVLSVLYFSENENLIRAAGFIVSHYVESPDDLIDLLPLLLRKKANVQMAIEVFMKDFDGQIDWQSQAGFLPQLLNNPNPFASLLVARILDRTKVDPSIVRQCISSGNQTFLEILNSQILDGETCFLLSFLNRYTTEPLECDAQVWIRKLKQ